jgi:hypothetical protein
MQLRNKAYQSAQAQNSAALRALNDAEQAQLMDFMLRIIADMRS